MSSGGTASKLARQLPSICMTVAQLCTLLDGPAFESHVQSTARQVRYASAASVGSIYRACPATVSLLAGRGAVHRSPEASPHAPRLLLVLDDAVHYAAD